MCMNLKLDVGETWEVDWDIVQAMEVGKVDIDSVRSKSGKRLRRAERYIPYLPTRGSCI